MYEFMAVWEIPGIHRRLYAGRIGRWRSITEASTHIKEKLVPNAIFHLIGTSDFVIGLLNSLKQQFPDLEIADNIKIPIPIEQS